MKAMEASQHHDDGDSVLVNACSSVGSSTTASTVKTSNVARVDAAGESDQMREDLTYRKYGEPQRISRRFVSGQ
jgi:hypothetical protein